MNQNSTAAIQDRTIFTGIRLRRFLRRFSALMAAVFLSAAVLVSPLSARAAGNGDKIFDYLTDELGYNVAAACGIMANIYAESSYSPTNASGGSYGLCQWLGNRRSNLYSWCSANGYSSSSIEGQLSFLNHELQSSYSSVYNYLLSVDNTSEGAGDAAWYFCYYYEAPANRSGQSSRRSSMASGSLWSQYAKYAEDFWEETEEGTKYWHKEGYYHTGWMVTDGDRYYFDEEGVLKTGLFSVKGSYYFANENGVMQTGWQTIGDSTYYFGEDGIMETGWIEVDGSKYYLDANGKLSSVNAFAEKSGMTDTDIANAVTSQEKVTEEIVSAPAAEPAGIEDKIADTAKSVQSAGADTQNTADVSSGTSSGDSSASSNGGVGNADTSDVVSGEGSSVTDSSISLKVPDETNPSADESNLGDAAAESTGTGITITTK